MASYDYPFHATLDRQHFYLDRNFICYFKNFKIDLSIVKYFNIYLFFITFLDVKDQIDGCDAFLVMYSVVDKASFTRAEYFLSLLHDLDLLKSRCCILIGNKIDLARSRAVSSQGKFPNSKLLSLIVD